MLTLQTLLSSQMEMALQFPLRAFDELKEVASVTLLPTPLLTARGQSFKCVLAYGLEEPISHLPAGFALHDHKRFIGQLTQDRKH